MNKVDLFDAISTLNKPEKMSLTVIFARCLSKIADLILY